MNKAKAHIIAIGDEVLYGQILTLRLGEINVELTKISDIKNVEKLNTLESSLSLLTNELYNILPNDIYNKDNQNLMSIISENLLKYKFKIATAESFTSGRISKELSSLSGSSAYFLGGITTYSTQQKINLLKINKNLINQYGTASKEVAEAMAKGALKLFNANIALSTTGVAGPNKDEFGVATGNGYIALATNKKIESHHVFYENLSRKDFSDKVSATAIYYLYKFLLQKNI